LSLYEKLFYTAKGGKFVLVQDGFIFSIYLFLFLVNFCILFCLY